MMAEYEVVIAGASFAGLAVAAQLAGHRVLVLDRKPIGTGETSACGTLVSTLTPLGLEGAIRAVHHELVAHTATRTRTYALPRPYCLLDYSHLCEQLWEYARDECGGTGGAGAEFSLQPATGWHEGGAGLDDGGTVQTPAGPVSGDLVVDASGWRAVLARTVRPGYVREDRLSTGVETLGPYDGHGLHFWYYPLPGACMGWAFPCGALSRVGVATYGPPAHGNGSLRADLDAFLQMLDVPRGPLHGGRFPSALREPLARNLFVAGDAAGQCLGVTGEGIRPALYLGTHLGMMLREVLEGRRTVRWARAAYRDLVMFHRRGYGLLGALQQAVVKAPPALSRRFEFLGDLRPARSDWLPQYLRAFPLDEDLARMEDDAPADGVGSGQ